MTPTPARFLLAKRQSGWFGLTITSASGSATRSSTSAGR
jgi:hypothetical protein